jgi:DNA-nicking Smr family endonuclease
MPDRDQAALRAPPPAPVPMQFLRDEARVIDELLNSPIDPAAAEPGGELAYLRDGHDPRLLKQLRRGVFSVQDELDLHQLKVVAARPMIRAFLADAQANGRRCVKLIHGKGLRSDTGPVLKGLVDGMLRQHGDVIAFASARAAEGGTGAVLVLLRSR